MTELVAKPKNYYRICESILDFDVENEVNELMASGWKPLGNLLVATTHDNEGDRDHVHYIQAMVKG